MIKQYGDSEAVRFEMLKDGWEGDNAELPLVISPPGMSAEQQWYLYEHMRQYCSPPTKDNVCPRAAAITKV